MFVALCLVFTGVTYAYLKWQFGKVDKIALCEVLRNCGDDDPGQPMNVLLVGSDSRREISPEEAEQFGTEQLVGGQRSDTIIVLHIDPRAEKAALMSIPRDLSVPISGNGPKPRRINTAFEKGPDVLISTIREQLGIEIDHYAQVDFNGFRGIVNAIGGVTLYFSSPVRDPVSGLNVAQPGCVDMDGNQALSFVRSRNFEYFESGKWRKDPTADLGRIERQQSFIRHVLGKASKVGRNPVRLNSIINSAVPNVKIDDAFSTKDILRLARRFKSFEPDAVEMLPLPTYGVREGGAAVLKLKQPEAGEIIERLKGVAAPEEASAPPPKVIPGTVRVRVLNGTGADGQAGSAAQALRAANFAIAGMGNAASLKTPQTVIKYGSGQLEKAKLLQAYVDGGTTLQEDNTLRGGDLVLTTGRGFNGIREAPDATPSTTATTAKAAATTTAPAAPAQPEC